MNDIRLTRSSRDLLTEKIRDEINCAIGKKGLEYRSGRFSLAEELRDSLEYSACTDKFDVFPDFLSERAETGDIHLIPESELDEDCYFGRFHIIYTVFGFFGLPRLVDEIMRLRRLILKGGKMVIFGLADDQSDAECIKQLKRCGFAGIEEEQFDLDGMKVFRISAVK